MSVPARTGESNSGDRNQYLSISMGGEVYGIELLRIKEIIQYESVTALPMMPGFVRGAINLRGKGVPVMDLALRFGRDDSDLSRRSCIVIVEAQLEGSEHFDVGLLVDAVNQVVSIDADAVEPAPSFGGRVRTDFLRGMGKVDGKFVVLLSLDRILTLDDLEEASRAAARAA